jgi:exocyst complex component 4
MLEGVSIEEPDLILDRRTLGSLCLLATSMKWLAVKLQSLRFISTQASESSQKRNSERWETHGSKSHRRWTLITSQKQSEPDHTFLPLTEETAAAFDASHTSYLQLSASALRLLHVELRCLVIHYTLKSMGGGSTHGPTGTGRTFLLDSEVNEPDPEIVLLNSHLATADSEFIAHLLPAQRLFLVIGLAVLLDDLIVAAASSPNILPAMNYAGSLRAKLNVLVLQQNLVNIEPGARLRRSQHFLDLFAGGPDVIVDMARKKGKKDMGYTFGEMKALIGLCYSEKMRSEKREEVVGAERGLEGHVLQLSEYLWDD